ncbi:MAG: hypothetical protein ACKVQC_10545 [Elusimicrobiota bacterium]
MNQKKILILSGLLIFLNSASHSKYKMTSSGVVEVKENESSDEATKEKIPPKTKVIEEKKINKNKVDQNVSHFQKNVQTFKDEKEVILNLSNQFSLSVDRIRYFRNINFGYAEIVPALVLAREAQIEPGKVLSARMEGKSWKNISKNFFVDFDNISKEVSDILTPIKKSLPASLIQARPQVSHAEK